ncbi:MAG: putative Rieske-type ferredoxin [Verrucomicrobia bacterium]|nr:putative Rieske-type ferredoxin [Verrucomicrobiota bacterium]
MAQRYPVTSLAAIPPGTALGFNVAGNSVAVFNVDGKLYAMNNTCPHAGAPLSDGYIKGCIVSCPWHGWDFDVTTGRMSGQAEDCQTTYPVHVNGDQVEVEV